MTSIRPRTSISADNLPAVSAPPTKIIGDHVVLDPKLVIDAWLASAEVLKTVAAAAQEAQDDNEFTRQTLEQNRKAMLRMGVGISILQIVSVGIMWYLRC